MDPLFLDANVLFSAAYREDAGVGALWHLPDAQLLSSSYAVEEARRNLADRGQLRRLDRLLRAVRLTDRVPDRPLPPGMSLPQKDRPILLGAIGAGATHLVTGDSRHFGRLFGETVAGIVIVTPARYLAQRGDRS